jgi:hypothetical protein
MLFFIARIDANESSIACDSIQFNSIQCVTYVQVARILYTALTHDAAARTGSAQFIVNMMVSREERNVVLTSPRRR